MKILTEESLNQMWGQFYAIFEAIGLSKYYDCEKLATELRSAPCGTTEDTGLAYKGALLSHINLTMGIAERLAKTVSGTFTIDKETLLKVCAIQHLSKRNMFIECPEDWKIKKGNLFDFNPEKEGCLKAGERSALEALNNGIKLTELEYEAVRIIDRAGNDSKNPYNNILSVVVRQANELAYAIAREKYNKDNAAENQKA